MKAFSAPHPFVLFLAIFLWSGLPEGVLAQEDRFGPCSNPVSWDRISVSDSPLPEDSDFILVATNRPYMPDEPDGFWFPNEIAEYRKLTYLAALCEEGSWTLHRLPDMTSGLKALDRGEDFLYFVHGHGKSMPAVLTRSHQINEKYPVHLVVFDWPSFNSNFNKSLSRVRRCGENYYNTLILLHNYRLAHMRKDQGMSMLLHSLGNYYLTHMVVNGNNQFVDETYFDNVIMNSAAVRSKEHGEVISQIKISKRIYVVYNYRDKVLRGAHLLTSGRMLGNEVMEPLAPNATYVDFTCVAGTQHTYFAGYHEFEFDLPAIGHFFETAIAGKEVDFSDKKLFQTGRHPNIHIVKDPEGDCPD